MTLSPLFHTERNTATIPVNFELVRGTEERITRELMPQIRQGSVALDLSQVERIDAAGIAALITLYCSANRAGNSFSIVDPSPHVLELLSLVGLASLLVTDGESRQTSPSAASQCGCPAGEMIEVMASAA